MQETMLQVFPGAVRRQEWQADHWYTRPFIFTAADLCYQINMACRSGSLELLAI